MRGTQPADGGVRVRRHRRAMRLKRSLTATSWSQGRIYGDLTTSDVVTSKLHISSFASIVALGWTDCGHDDWRPGVVLDPFAGSGTTLAVAVGHGRNAIGIDLDERNVELAQGAGGPMFFEEGVHLTRRCSICGAPDRLELVDLLRRLPEHDHRTGVRYHPSGWPATKPPPSLVASSPPPPASASNAPSPGRFRPKRGSRPCGASTTKPPKSGTG